MDPAQAHDQFARMIGLFIPMILMFWAVGAAIIIIPFWQIFKKAGMAPGLAFLMILPLVNLVMIYVLAFSDWKVIPGPMYAQPVYPPYPPPAYAPPAQAYVPPVPPTPSVPEPPTGV